MQYIQLGAGYAYRESYVPPRCRKPRIREIRDACAVRIPSVRSVEAPVAMRHRRCWFPEFQEYRWFEGNLYARVPYSRYLSNAKGWYPLEELQKKFFRPYIPPYEVRDSREEAMQACQDRADQFLVVNDDQVWERIGEPRYVIATFGLGHNHASTALMIENSYNDNIRGDYYFSALEREKAVERCVEVALARGDTESVDHISDSWEIEVFIPEAVRCNPAAEAGPGNDFLNRLDTLVELSSTPTEAALLAMLSVGTEIKKEK